MMSKILRLLIHQTGLTEAAIRRIAATAPMRYKRYTIQKRNGGDRVIAQPAKEVKLLQRALMHGFLDDLPIHPTATAYRKGMSIRDNALMHAGRTQILKMDFQNFFPSIKESDWINYCQSTLCLSDEYDIYLTTQILFQRNRSRELNLAIGAPSSPMLSNIIMYDFDEKISTLVAKDNVKYTRYADDLTFSAPRTGYLTGVKKNVYAEIRKLKFPKLKINTEKTNLITAKYSRSVTGLILSNDGRVTIGSHRKRLIRSALHNFFIGSPTMEYSKLAGLLAFCKSSEPQYFDAVLKKYGTDVVNKILSYEDDKKE